DQLGLEDSADEPGHRAEETSGRSARGDPRRDRRAAGAELDERARERVEQAIHVEQAHDVRLGEEEEALRHEADFETVGSACADGSDGAPLPFPFPVSSRGRTGSENCVGLTSMSLSVGLDSGSMEPDLARRSAPRSRGIWLRSGSSTQSNAMTRSLTSQKRPVFSDSMRSSAPSTKSGEIAAMPATRIPDTSVASAAMAQNASLTTALKSPLSPIAFAVGMSS